MGRSVTMIFDADARLDGLEKREEIFGESLTETFRNRSDRLNHRQVIMIADEALDSGGGGGAVSGNSGGGNNNNANGGPPMGHAFTIPGGPAGDFLIESMVQEFGAYRANVG